MYKLAIKFLVITLVLTGACLALSSNDKALAATTSCPSGDSVPGDWGNDSDGEGAGVMSSLIMKARDTSGNLLNPHFTLTSQAPGWPDNAQIYRWPIGSGGSVSNTDNWPQHGDFQFGTHLSGDGGINCNGWVALGPGIDGNVGNGWVLNCKNPSGNNNVFQITHIDNPVGQSGRWQMLDSSGNLLDDNVNSGSSPHIKFPVTNGANMRFTFVWVPAPTPPPTYGTCQRLDVGLSGSYFGHNKRAHVVVNQVTNGQVKINGGSWQGGTGGNIDENIPSDSGGTGSYDKVYAYQPQANSISVTVTVEYHDSSGWHLVPGAGNPNVIRTTDQPCFAAQCSIQYVDGDGPGGIVLAGHSMHVHGTYYNTSPSPDNLPIWNPSLNVSGSQNGSNNGVHTLWSSPPPAYTGSSYDFDIYLTAPNNVTRDNFSMTPIYFNNAAIGGACSGGIPFGGEPVYQQFNASLSASSVLKPTIEHPYQGDDYKTSINVRNDSSHNVNIPTNSSFYKRPAGGGQIGIAANSGGTYPSSPGGTTSNTLSGHYDIPAGSYVAGDEFCAHIHADYTTGYVGPDNNVIFGANPADSTSCPRVANEPYFKVYNSDISAGGDFDQCTTDGGTLAGYADINDPPGAARGSSAQLSALALVKITGVASAQSPSSITGSPTKLSFANTGVQVDSGGNESPVLGGQFGGCRTLTNETAPASATAIGSSTPASLSAGAYKHSGNTTITGGTLGANQNVSIFVDGDAYISGDIAYGNNWQAGTAPSFVLHASGNIYIAPGVHQLAGVYIAQEKSDGSKGKIYTCADTSNHFSPMSAVNLYNGCKNQLVIAGSFVAKQINLMRSFGSLRDEEPNPGTPGGATENIQWSSCGTYGSPVGGEDCLSKSPTQLGLRCINTDEPSENPASIWADNILCIPNSSGLHMAWTHYSNNPGVGPYTDPLSGWAPLSVLAANGYKYCTPWNVAAEPSGQTWYDNVLCMDQKRADGSALLHFVSKPSDDPSANCIPIKEIADHDGGQWDSTGYFLCQPQSSPTAPSPKGPPFSGCSNSGAQIDTKACAGEIFEYSPTLYLSRPAVNPPGGSGGPLQLQSITSLPPVL
jgi:hypothetical protein